MCHHRVDGDEEGFCYLFVGEALNDLHDDFLLSLAQGFARWFALGLEGFFYRLASASANILFQATDAFSKERVLHVAMAVQVFVRHEDVHEHFAHERCAVVAGIVLHDDALQLAQALLDVGVLLVVLLLDAAERLLGQSTLQKCLDIRMHVIVLEGHVVLHLLCILVVETEDKHGQAVAAGKVDGLEQLTSYARQTEVNKVAVGILKVSDECRYVHLLHHLADASMGRVFHIVDYGQERADVHSSTAASSANSLVAKAKLNAKAANNLFFSSACA